MANNARDTISKKSASRSKENYVYQSVTGNEGPSPLMKQYLKSHGKMGSSAKQVCSIKKER